MVRFEVPLNANLGGTLALNKGNRGGAENAEVTQRLNGTNAPHLPSLTDFRR
jgi:hypothetical protein